VKKGTLGGGRAKKKGGNGKICERRRKREAKGDERRQKEKKGRVGIAHLGESCIQDQKKAGTDHLIIKERGVDSQGGNVTQGRKTKLIGSRFHHRKKNKKGGKRVLMTLSEVLSRNPDNQKSNLTAVV